MKNLLLAAFVLCFLLIQGCTYWQELESRRYAPKIGMTKEQVLGSVWSSPRRKEKTTTASGTSEIWIYAGPSFLFFDETGILRQIDSPF